MIGYNRFKNKIDFSNLREFSFRGFDVSIDEALNVKINDDLIKLIASPGYIDNDHMVRQPIKLIKNPNTKNARSIINAKLNNTINYYK